MNILLGVTGSIAAYKSADLTSRLVHDEHSVKVIMTKNATQFVTPLTFQTLSQNTVYVEQFTSYENDVEHISLSHWADLLVVAPATANTIAKMAHGIADDMFSTTVLSFTKTIIIAPAMNTAMYENVATQDNISTLTNRGVVFIEPRESRLACGDVGKGAMASVDTILERVYAGN